MTIAADNGVRWRQFVMDLESLQLQLVEEIFDRHGAFSITLSDAGDASPADAVLEPLPGETPLWNETRVSALFEADADLESLQDDLRQSLQLQRLPPHRVEEVGERAWERQWLEFSGPARFGDRLWVCPWDHEPDEAGEPVIVFLDPGLAFGTGAHETTALCLRWLDGLDLAGKTVLDYGCGSGILAVAALKLGAGQACAYDIDPQAITATRANAVRNGVAEVLTVTQNPEHVGGNFDVVIANILAGPLKMNAHSICRSLVSGGRLALSGILSAQAAGVIDAYRDWIRFDPVELHNDWARLTGSKA